MKFINFTIGTVIFEKGCLGAFFLKEKKRCQENAALIV